MSKVVTRYVKPIVTRGRARKASRLRDMLSALEDPIVTFEEFIGDVKKRLDEVEGGLTDGLQSMKEQLKDYVW
ncbi:hypothetical protein PVK06_048570 [Gossypium arboreum]|uniref:Uncharacterized protein n=1 Tax=Gossypium arboreum TaxID=29729 RepID=A0ABR0MGB6_GOSAR|nr:hypothetical protein PVK06_048570 [Gossypium arboreum]